VSARVVSRGLAVAGSLAAALLAAAPVTDPLGVARREAGWVAWAVPITRGDRAPCCFRGWRGGEAIERGCVLEGGRSRGGMFGTIDSPRMRPTATALQLFVRFVDGRVDRVLAVGDDCPVDVGATPVHALDGVTPTASATLLAEVAQHASGELVDQALHALSLHERVGTDALLAVARDGRQPGKTRHQAFFWLGQSDDPRAFAELEAILTR
jgi:hypothetical protein